MQEVIWTGQMFSTGFTSVVSYPAPANRVMNERRPIDAAKYAAREPCP